METQLSLKEKTVTISPAHPFVVIGERINPTRRKKLAQSLAEGDFSLVQEEAKMQVEAGAQVLDVNAGVPGADEPAMLTGAVKAIMEVVNVPLCFDSANPKALAAALERIGSATQAAWSTGVAEEALANATPYLQAFGHVVLAWLWLDIALTARDALPAATGDRADLLQGKIATMRYFFGFELPKVEAWLAPVASRDPSCREMRDAWF